MDLGIPWVYRAYRTTQAIACAWRFAGHTEPIRLVSGHPGHTGHTKLTRSDPGHSWHTRHLALLTRLEVKYPGHPGHTVIRVPRHLKHTGLRSVPGYPWLTGFTSPLSYKGTQDSMSHHMVRLKRAAAKQAKNYNEKSKQLSPINTPKKRVGASTSEPLPKRFSRHASGKTKVPPTPPADFDSTKFLSAQVKELFNKKFSPKLLIIERELLLEELTEMHVAECFQSRGWESMITDIVPPSTSVIHELYSNMHNFIDATSFIVYFRGQSIEVDPSVLTHCLSLPRVYKPTYPYSDKTRPSINEIANYLAQKQLKFKAKEFTSKLFNSEHLILSRIISTNIFPTRHLSALSFERMRFLYAFLINDHIDLPSHICAHMVKVFHFKSTTNRLPYCCLIMKFLAANFISIPQNEPREKIQTVGKLTLSQNLRKIVADVAFIRKHFNLDEASSSADPQEEEEDPLEDELVEEEAVEEEEDKDEEEDEEEEEEAEAIEEDAKSDSSDDD
ncbi:hypothetical protein CJ030_MR3G001112 [Morella rubra]|uniref:Putative plant transposon protein domain-containing protein n=1 Tax=Morella rubra TaxID=262757 RepID=A0A6A1W2U3_9ROSI|nr:hypothetical protein CJ030_MR3G001112 [Morella rubra]